MNHHGIASMFIFSATKFWEGYLYKLLKLPSFSLCSIGCVALLKYASTNAKTEI
jgi:hypothetical protein